MRRRSVKFKTQRSAEDLASLERGSPRATSKDGDTEVIEKQKTKPQLTKMPEKPTYMAVPRAPAKSVAASVPTESGTYYAFSSKSRQPARRNALVVLFSAAILFFATFAMSKIPFIVDRVVKDTPIEFSANLAGFGLSTGVEVTTRWTFIIPHIIVASGLEILFALIMLRKIRMYTPWVQRGVFALTVIHCVLIAPNWRGLPGPAGNILFTSICLLAAIRLQFFDPKSQLAFSWLVLAINSGPVGEVGFWLINLRENLLAWREAMDSSEKPSQQSSPESLGSDDIAATHPPASTAYGLLLAFGILLSGVIVVVFVLVAVYNVWFFTYKYGALPRSLFSWCRGT